MPGAVGRGRKEIAREHFLRSHFETNWPGDLIRTELEHLLFPDARFDDVETLLYEVFLSEDSVEEFRRLPVSAPYSNPWETEPDSPSKSIWQDRHSWLRDLWRVAPELPSPAKRLPYWSQRDTSGARKLLDFAETKKKFVDLVSTLSNSGYLANAFGFDCVDDPEPPSGVLGSEPLEEIERLLGRPGLWHPESHYVRYDFSDFCDVVELTADLVARPRQRHYHSWDQCGWHYSLFAREPGLRLYRHLINDIFSESELEIRLGSNGRLERTSNKPTEKMVADMRTGRSDDDPVAVAAQQFRQVGAREESKRGAIVTLAGVLEGRRAMLKENMFRKDEGALFQIANEFDLRHRKADQKSDYDRDLYFEWIFYFYLSTIQLTDGIVARSMSQDDSGALDDIPPF